MDYAASTLAAGRRRGVSRLVAGDGVALPFADGTFDCVLALDVIEHFEDDAAVMREAVRCLRTGGLMVLSVPAFMALWRTHDELYGHYRRYRRRQLIDLIDATGLRLLECHFTRCLLFFPLLVWARMNRGGRPDRPPRDDFFELPRWLNHLLHLQIVWEARSGVNRVLPFGVSLLAIGRKPSPAA